MAAELCCGQLALVLGSKVSYLGNSTYTTTQKSYWSIQEADLIPACIVVPESSQDVADAVSVIVGIPDAQFAIKGQSHAPAAGFANINGGITIDMTQLSSVTVNANHSIASVGAGASWLDVYNYLDTLGVEVAGGRNGAVGVGGLTLGGGISHFTPRVGLACDNVVNFEIVLASGKLTNVNATSSPDLFRALKGGANNFGIVTRFDLQTFSQGKFFSGTVNNPITEREAVFKAFANIAGAPQFDIYASLVTGFIFNSTSKAWSIGSAAVYTKPEMNPPVFKELFAIPNVGNSSVLTNLSTLAAEPPTPPLNWLFYTGTYGVSATLLGKIFDALNETIYGFDIPEGILWSVAFEPFPTAITKHAASTGGNSLGTSPKDGNAFIMLLAGLWPHTSSDALVEKTAQKTMMDVNAVAKGMGMLHEFQYINYADPSQDPIASYGAASVQRLREASRKYDPKSVFQKQVPGGFKLGL